MILAHPTSTSSDLFSTFIKKYFGKLLYISYPANAPLPPIPGTLKRICFSFYFSCQTEIIGLNFDQDKEEGFASSFD